LLLKESQGMQFAFPEALQFDGDEAQGGVDLFVAAVGKGHFVASAVALLLPLLGEGLALGIELVEGGQGQLQGDGSHGGQKGADDDLVDMGVGKELAAGFVQLVLGSLTDIGGFVAIAHA
jgi:hypothetical protein